MAAIHQDQLKELERRYLVLSAVISGVLDNAINKEKQDQYQAGIWVRLTDVMFMLSDIASRPVGYSNMEEIISEHVGRFS